jgi:hypothetical protein
MKAWHDVVAAEMVSRGGNHASPYEMPDLSYLPERDLHGKVDMEYNREKLMRCPKCKERVLIFNKENRNG